jgi:hypothetical protein
MECIHINLLEMNMEAPRKRKMNMEEYEIGEASKKKDKR